MTKIQTKQVFGGDSYVSRTVGGERIEIQLKLLWTKRNNYQYAVVITTTIAERERVSAEKKGNFKIN